MSHGSCSDGSVGPRTARWYSSVLSVQREGKRLITEPAPREKRWNHADFRFICGQSVSRLASTCGLPMKNKPAWDFLLFLDAHMSCIPACGVFSTAVLLLLVHYCLLSKLGFPCDDSERLNIPVSLDKKHKDDKAGEKPGAEKLNSRRWKDTGTVDQSLKAYKQRAGYLDVRAKQQAFLSIWAVANLLQGALTIVVLVLSIITIYTHWPRNKQVVGFPLAILLLSVFVVTTVKSCGILDLTLDDSLLHFLQRSIQREAGLESRVTLLTGIANFSIVLVSIVTPLSVGLLLKSPEPLKKRLERFQDLMYWTAFLLVVGVIQVNYQNRWSALLFDDDLSIQSVTQMAAGTGLLVGGVFTVASGLVFLPAGFLLNWANTAAKGSTSKKSWFMEIASVLAPVVAALPIAKLFEIVN
jgi:hypothetical protein